MSRKRLETNAVAVVALAGVVLAVAGLPLVLPTYAAFELTYVGAFAIALMGLVVLTGYGGQISLGHGAFIALGGYTVAILAQRTSLPYWLSIALAAMLSGALGIVLGLVALRLAGVYLALATFALASAVPPFLKRFHAWTGGSGGILLRPIATPRALHGMAPERWLYYEIWALTGALFVVTAILLDGRTGRALRALRDNETAAIAFGVNPYYYKTLAFGWSAAYAGIAGGVLAVATAFVSPESYGFTLSLTLLIGAAVGGVETLWGAVPGAIIVVFLPLWAQTVGPAAPSIAYGTALIATMLFMPAGIAGTLLRFAKRRTPASAARLVVVLLAATGAISAGAAENSAGVTSTEIVLGGSHPFSGPASAYGAIGRGAEAYFAYINDRGGVNGRKITYKDLDDAYSPAQAVQVTRRLVEQDRVFAIFNTLGTAVNIAIRPYLNAREVPQLFVSSGATTWARDFKRFPWTIGWSPDYRTEATIYARDVLARKPGAAIAALYQDDDYGQDYLAGLTAALGTRAGTIIKAVSYETTDPDVSSQIANLKASGADTLFIFATPKFATQALVAAAQQSWKPLIYLNNVAASQNVMRAAATAAGPAAVAGVLTALYVKDPADPHRHADRGFELYRQIAAKYLPGVDSSDELYAAGMAVAYTLVDALERTGRDVTRLRVMATVNHLRERDNPFLLPGIEVRTTPANHYAIAQEQLERYDAATARWVPFGLLIDARAHVAKPSH